MKQHLEIEYKTQLTQDEFNHILNSFPFKDPKYQENTYYDTPKGSLFKQHSMCRIRTIGNIHEFTLKVPQEEGVLEYEVILNEKSLMDERIIDFLNEKDIDVNTMEVTAFSNTVRYEYSDIYGVWCLDYTRFLNNSDYELEYELHESNEKAYPHYLDTLQLLGIQYKPSKPKYLRALDSSAE
ncbi:CYTH domain-containing protein [Erysipelothrix piscisicarius]|uniref:CYTH domain-containing protein n=1 Tax=Erysipelothrix piscisicarius TaxID=2485784 RepID=UPI002F9521EF